MKNDLIKNFEPYKQSFINFCKAQGIVIDSIDYKKIYDILQQNNKQKMFKTLNNVLDEQKIYFEKNIYNTKKNYSDYNTWLIVAYLNKEPYGSVFLFQNKKNHKIYRFQGIAKYYEAVIFSLLYPEKKLKSLNELLVPFIENFVKQIGGTKIYVNPIGVQYEILTKKYGFKNIATMYGTWDDYISDFGGKPVVKKFIIK